MITLTPVEEIVAFKIYGKKPYITTDAKKIKNAANNKIKLRPISRREAKLMADLDFGIAWNKLAATDIVLCFNENILEEKTYSVVNN